MFLSMVFYKLITIQMEIIMSEVMTIEQAIISIQLIIRLKPWGLSITKFKVSITISLGYI